MDKYYASPWKASYIVGIINLSLNFSLYIIFTFASCSKGKFCSLEYKGSFYIDNIISFFDVYKGLDMILFFFIHLITSIRYILFNVILENFTIFHIFLSYQIVSFLKYILFLFEEDNTLFITILIIFTYLIEIFATFVFLEIIELNFLGLNKNLKKNIEQRAFDDSRESTGKHILLYEINDTYHVCLDDNDEEKENNNFLDSEYRTSI